MQTLRRIRKINLYSNVNTRVSQSHTPSVSRNVRFCVRNPVFSLISWKTLCGMELYREFQFCASHVYACCVIVQVSDAKVSSARQTNGIKRSAPFALGKQNDSLSFPSPVVILSHSRNELRVQSECGSRYIARYIESSPSRRTFYRRFRMHMEKSTIIGKGVKAAHLSDSGGVVGELVFRLLNAFSHLSLGLPVEPFDIFRLAIPSGWPASPPPNSSFCNA